MAYTTIDDPSAHFQALVYAGTGGDAGASQPTTHTNDGNSDLQPDFIWFKDRGASYSHYLVDSSRGRAKGLKSDTTATETTSGSTAWDLVSFDTDGFKVGAPSEGNSTNGGTTSKVAWQWKANGGTTASNTSGSITSTVQANTDAGFSIVTYTGTGSVATIGHGLGVAPDVIIAKNRDTSANWMVKHTGTTNNYDFLYLNTTGAAIANDGAWTQTDPTSTVFSIGINTAVNQNTTNIIAYCFAEKQGYSKFGKYTGNGNSDGPFVYTGFKPTFVMLKRTNGAGGWTIYDNKRGQNGNNYELFPHSAEVEYTGTSYFEADILSNGFKLRLTNSQVNGSGDSYIYMAFAENPFTTSTGIPTTAR